MIKPIRAILNTKRKNKRLISIGYDIFAIAISIYLAIALRLGTYSFELGLDEWVTLLLTISVTIFTFAKLGMYRAVLRYMMFPAVGNIFLAVFISSLTLVMSGFFFHTFIPRSVPFIYF